MRIKEREGKEEEIMCWEGKEGEQKEKVNDGMKKNQMFGIARKGRREEGRGVMDRKERKEEK